MLSHLQRVSSTIGTVGTTTSTHNYPLCSWGTTYLQPAPPREPTLMSPMVVYLAVVGGTLCPDSTKGPARQPQPAPPLNATHTLYSRPWCNCWGSEWALPVAGALYSYKKQRLGPRDASHYSKPHHGLTDIPPLRLCRL